MAVTNHERVGKGLDLLRAGLSPFVERELKRAVHAGDLDEYRLRQILSDPESAAAVRQSRTCRSC